MGHVNLNASQAQSAAYRYVNLSGQQFLVFSIIEPESQLPTSTESLAPPQQLAALLRLVPSSSPRSLDALATGLQLSDAVRTKQRQLNIFLAPEPPGTEIDRLHLMFPGLPRDYLLRNLLVTRDVEKTCETLLAITRAADDGKLPVDPSPPFMGPFPRMTDVS